MNKSVNPNLINLALEHAEGFSFERFAQELFANIEGKDFVPFGGLKDQGIDGIYQTDKERTFYQITKQENHREKIRDTVSKIKKSGRELKRLIYITSREMKNQDKEEDNLTDELDVIIKIRDRKFIASHINQSIGTIASYYNHLAIYTEYLNNISKNNVHNYRSKNIIDPSVFVFLQHELDKKNGDKTFSHSVAETMILWALSETDPEHKIFMSEEEISNKIFDQFPWVKSVITTHIHNRLQILKGISDKNKRKIRWYKKEKKYCLPYETRQLISLENAEDENNYLNAIEEIKTLSNKYIDIYNDNFKDLPIIIIRILHKIFEHQGLLFADFLKKESSLQEAPMPIVMDFIRDEVSNLHINIELREKYTDILLSTMREIFYFSSDVLKKYLNNLSKTYALLFSLKAEPKIIDFFNSMTAKFRLFLGSDVLVMALSERFLPTENQTARNLLKIASQTGAKLYLSECVLNEIYTHISATHWEFVNNIKNKEENIEIDVIKHSDRILIRSYFYAKKENKINSWNNYIDQFLSIKYIEKSLNQGIDDLRRYLISEYNLVFVSNEDLEKYCNSDEVQQLFNIINDDNIKQNEELAYNTALQIHSVYGFRKHYKEISNVSEFGYNTWWVTNQTRVFRLTKDIIKKNSSYYVMKPEFLLNFISFSPKIQTIKESWGSIFPTIFGLQLGHRLPEEDFKKLLDSVSEWKSVEPGRIMAKISQMSDKLKSNQNKDYDHPMKNMFN